MPLPVRRLLQSCLEKDPKHRLRDIGDAWRLLEEPAKPKTRTIWPWVAAASILAIAALIGWLRPACEPQTSITLSIALPPGDELVGQPVISPDGKSVWYETKDFRVHLRRIDSLQSHLLPGRPPSPRSGHPIQPLSSIGTRRRTNLSKSGLHQVSRKLFCRRWDARGTAA